MRRFSGDRLGFQGVGGLIEDSARRHRAESKKRFEKVLDVFLDRLPAWRCGQRDAGRSVPSQSPDRGDGWDAGGPSRRARHRSRTRSRSRGRRKDKEKDKKEKKKKDDEKTERAGDVSRSRSRGRKEKKSGRDRSPDGHSPARAGRGSFLQAPASLPSTAQAARPEIAPTRPAPPPGPAPPAGAGGEVPEWLSDLFQPPPPPETVAPLPAPHAHRPQSREIMVPQSLVSRLIGKGGDVIMGICHASGADVKVRQETKDLGYSLAVITGRSEAIDAAEAMVTQRLGMAAAASAKMSSPAGALISTSNVIPPTPVPLT